jgi:TonB family protein
VTALSNARMAELSSPAAVLEIETAAPWVRKWSSPWVRGPLWDGFWILSALWLAPIVVLLAHGYSNPESSPLDLLYFGLTALFWIHHRLSSTYLAYPMSDPQVRAAASGLMGKVARRSRRKSVSSFALVLVLAFVSVCSLDAQIGTPAAGQQPPKAIYTPRPVYRPEWAKQGLTGKGVVLVTIDQQTGKVTGARMLQSTGNKLLDGAALEAYSQWRFQPGTGSQVKIPIEFATRPKPPAPKRTAPPPAILYPLLILLGFGVAVMAMRGRRRNIR